MRLRSIVAAVVCAGCSSLVDSPVSAQACVGQPGNRGSVTLGLAGTDGASGLSIDAAVRSGPVHIGVTHAKLDKFAQVDDIVSTGLHLAWPWSDGPTELCVVGASEWTRYEDGPGYQSTHGGYRVVGDYGRIRSPLGISVGREFWRGHRVSINPFLTLAVVHDHEWMHWTEGGVTKRDTFGPGSSFGFTTRIGRMLLRSQVNNAWTQDRALSDVNNHWSLLVHLGLAF